MLKPDSKQAFANKSDPTITPLISKDQKTDETIVEQISLAPPTQNAPKSPVLLFWANLCNSRKKFA